MEHNETVYTRVARLSHEAHQDLTAAAENSDWNESAAQRLLGNAIVKQAERDRLLQQLGMTLEQALERWASEVDGYGG